jgi:hypothetical protein
MNTKKALGALLGLLGSLPAFPFLPLAGFSAPLLFTASLQMPKQSSRRRRRQRQRQQNNDDGKKKRSKSTRGGGCHNNRNRMLRTPRNRSTGRTRKKRTGDSFFLLGIGLGGALGFGPLHGGFERRHGAQRSDPRLAEGIPVAGGRIGVESRAKLPLAARGEREGGKGKGRRRALQEGRAGAGDKKEGVAQGHISDSARAARARTRLPI